MQSWRKLTTVGLLLGPLACGVAAPAAAQPADEAEGAYQEFRRLYAAAETAEALRDALKLALKANELAPGRYKYAFGIGAAHERLAEFTDCERWFATAVDLAADADEKEKARVHREYCQNELDKMAVSERSSVIRIAFATKLAFAQREMNAAPLSAAFPGIEADEPATAAARVKQRLPDGMAVVPFENFVIARRGGVDNARKEGERIAEYDAQIRRRFFPDLARRSVIFILGEEPFELRRVTETLYPGAAVPNAPFFGFYHKPDRLALATALGGYGTVLHELMHAHVQDDFPEAPLWLEEGMAMLYERSGWSAEKLIPVANWRMDLITLEQAVAEDAFAAIHNTPEILPQSLALIRLLFTYLDQNDKLAALYAEVKSAGPSTTLPQALMAVGIDRAAWGEFAERSFREYAIETSKVSGGGLSNPGEIKYVQRALNAVTGAGLTTDGLWGSRTEEALRDFQGRFGLDVDGVVGRNTLRVLRREFGKASLE